ncbi:MAG TPA: DUF664 domain-containing protein [Sporichthyaceae bacterium]|jgi:hypothetical protein
MDTNALVLELYGRIPPLAHEVVKGLTAEQLMHRPAPHANHIGWLIWHTARVEDHQPAEVGGYEQVWVSQDWAGRFGDPVDPDDHGYGHTSEQVAGVRTTSAEDLLAYSDAVHERTVKFLGGLTDADLDRIVDRNWDPPVTLGVRLISIADDCLQHLGQAAYLRGLLVG